MNATTPQLPVTENRDFTLGEYIAMRDTTWNDLKNPDRLSVARLERLELCNNVVKILLNSRAESLERMLQVLSCHTCEVWIARARRELRAFNCECAFPLNEREALALLKVALAKDSELIPQPAPSSVLPIPLNGQSNGS